MKKQTPKSKKQKAKTSRGFTLIELMVSTSIFIVVMLIAMGSLIVTSDSAKKSQALSFTMDNLNFAMESMSRSIRMGTNYTCASSVVLGEGLSPSNCTSKEIIAFIPAKASSSVRLAYKREARADGTYTIKKYDTRDGSNGVDVISTNIDIKKLKFYVKGAEESELIQPSVYMIVKGAIIIKGEETSFSIQTMVSQRTLK